MVDSRLPSVQIRDIQLSIGDALVNVVSRNIDEILTKVQKSMNALQSKFFSYLATSAGVIGANQSPNFPGIDLPQPDFKPLSVFYQDRKEKKFGGSGASFFLYSGYLKGYLERTNPVSKFGKPIVTLVRPGVQNDIQFTSFKTRGGFKKTIRASNDPYSLLPQLQGIFGRIFVDLFPKLKDFDAYKTANFFPPTIAYRLDNYKGRKDRAFMTQYMQWWLQVKGKDALRKAIAA